MEARRRKAAAQAVLDRLREPIFPPGISIQYGRSFDMGGRRSTRMEVLYGYGILRPEAAQTITIYTEEAD